MNLFKKHQTATKLFAIHLGRRRKARSNGLFSSTKLGLVSKKPRKAWTLLDCRACRAGINQFIRIDEKIKYQYEASLKMIKSHEDLKERIFDLETRLTEVEADKKKLLEENNFARIIGLTSPSGNFNLREAEYSPAHKVSLDELPIELVIARLRVLTKLSTDYAAFLNSKNSKLTIKQELTSQRETKVKKEREVVTKELEDSKESYLKKHFPGEYKALRGTMKSFKCDEVAAARSILAMSKSALSQKFLSMLSVSTKKALAKEGLYSESERS